MKTEKDRHAEEFQTTITKMKNENAGTIDKMRRENDNLTNKNSDLETEKDRDAEEWQTTITEKDRHAKELQTTKTKMKNVNAGTTDKMRHENDNLET